MSCKYQKWKISLVSTDLDLHDLRNAIEEDLSKLGFEMVAFERPDYAPYPTVHSHEACILALQKSDIVMLIIDKRYGGLYLGRGPESITMKEYSEACESGKIIIPCVRAKAIEGANSCFKTVERIMKEDDLSSDDAREKIRPVYVDNWQVLDFIEKIRTADKDEFIISFDSKSDLIKKLEGRLHGLSLYICHKIVRKQMEIVRNMRTAGLVLSLGDVLEKGYFIEPPQKVISGPVKPDEKLSEVCDLSEEDKRVMMIGEPGTGKSTLLAKSFLNHAEMCLEKKEYRVPFHLNLRGLGLKYHFDFDRFIDECFNRNLGKERYPLFDRNEIRPVFYIDGFDEIAEQFQDIDLRDLIDSDFFSSPFVACSRTRFLEERLQYSGLENKIGIITKLIPWQKELSWNYIERFCKLRGNPEAYDRMRDAYYDDIAMSEILENPLLLTTFLWIVETSGMGLPLGIKDRVSVYEQFIERWTRRELQREGTRVTPAKVENMTRAWQLTAWEIYKRRFLSEAINEEQLKRSVLEKNKKLKGVLNTPAFLQFLDIQPITMQVRGMFHEQFMEHLLAKELVECCRESRYPFPEFLEYEIRPEINRTIKTLWSNEADDDKETTLGSLWGVYERHLGENTSSGIRVRNHAMYYVGRLAQTSYDEARKRLEQADTLERNPFVILSIAFGLMELEDYDREDKLYEQLKDQEVMDETNRGYHLVYYGDWVLIDEEPPYLDNGTKNWARTLIELIRHIQSEERSHITLRRIELFTIKRFMEVRGCRGPMMHKYFELIRESVDRMEDKPQGFLEKVRDAYVELENTFNALPASKNQVRVSTDENVG